MKVSTFGFIAVILSAVVGSSAVSVDWKFPDDSTACIGAKLDIDNVVLTHENQTAELSFDNVTTAGLCGTSPGSASSNLNINLANGDRMGFTFSVSGTDPSSAVTRMDILFTFDPANYFQNVSSELLSMNDEGDTQLSPPDMLYRCLAADTKMFEYNEAGVIYQMSLTMSNAEIQAFNMNGNFTDEVFECGADDVTSPSTAAATSPQAVTSEAPSNASTTEPPTPSNASTTEPPTPSNASTTEPPTPSNASTTEPPQSTAVVTTEPPVTTPKPNKASIYTYKEGNKTCVRMQASLQLQVQYEDTSNNTKTKTLNVPDQGQVTTEGKCSEGTGNDTTSFLTISFGNQGSRRTLTFNFKVDQGRDMLTSVSYLIDLDAADFPNAKDTMLNGTMEITTWSTLNRLFFKCDAVQTLGAAPVTIITRELKEQAFGFENDDFNNDGYECGNDTGVVPKTAPSDQYEVRDEGQTCVVFKGALMLSLPYTKITDGKPQNTTASVAVPGKDATTVNGSCGTNETNAQFIELNFYDGWKLKLTFQSDATPSNLLQAAKGGKNYELSNVDVTYVLNNNIFEDVANPGETRQMSGNVTADTFKASTSGSYTCAKDQTVNLGQFSMTTKDMQFQAFMTKANFTGFGESTECAKDDETNSIVPIAVGAALAGLVIIVLIAYLIGRRRSRSGYEQV